MIELIRSGRLRRMCVKELRETLRDRRTLFTLILMPLLVYPLLSMTLQRIIITSLGNTTSDVYLVGVRNQEEMQRFGEVIFEAQKAIASKAYRPLRIERQTPLSQQESVTKEPIRWKAVIVEKDLNLQLDAGHIDIAVRVIDAKSIQTDPDKPNSVQPVLNRFEVGYRQGDGHSEAAVYALQELLGVINDQEALLLRTQSGLSPEAAVELQAVSIGQTPTLLSSIASIIPLILVLMTITGAVYPAIDLTAGERERGTMEALISTPVPRFALLFSKYIAIVSVSILTAIVNVLGMFVTLSVGGLGRAILGAEGFPWSLLIQIFPLLVLFSGFFAAILLAICCVAKSFKEAQAYLIPVMLVSIGPGILSVMPGVNLTPNMAVVPLFNMILLARDVLVGHFQWLPAIITLGSTIVYSIAVMIVASKLFGRHAIVQQSEVSWRNFCCPSKVRGKLPNISELLVFLALFFPIYFVSTNTIGVAEEMTLANRLWEKAGLTVVLFLVLPMVYVGWRGLNFQIAYPLFGDRKWILLLPAFMLLAFGLWTLAHEIFVLSEWLGIASLRPEQITAANETQLALKKLPLVFIWITMAIIPAIAEELFFRGFALQSIRSVLKPSHAIIAAAVLFGAFHVVAGSLLSIERFLPTALLGWVLGWTAWKTHSLIPGMLVHAVHNGLLFTIARYENAIREFGWGIQDQRHLPLAWIISGISLVIIGMGAIEWQNRTRNEMDCGNSEEGA